MNKKITYFLQGFTNAFGSSREFYTIEKNWEITKRIQNKRKGLKNGIEERAKENIASIYA